eukprot:scaffold51_cov401-Prasinococcus_capsulatus_cf.AAC.21
MADNDRYKICQTWLVAGTGIAAGAWLGQVRKPQASTDGGHPGKLCAVHTRQRLLRFVKGLKAPPV